MKVNFVDLGRQYKELKAEIMDEISLIIDKGSFMGAKCFEDDFAKFNEKEFCVGVGSGTDALILTLLAYGIGPGDQVIVPANTYIATAFAVSHTGADPIFIDPNPNTYVIDVDGIMAAVTPRTRAIIPVHLYGYPANMKDIMVFAKLNNLIVIEDCAQAAGAFCDGKRVGSWADAGCFSFYPAKNLGGLGQGGAVVTNNPEIAKTVRELGNIGRSEGSWYEYSHVGFNSRLDAVNSKFLSVCLDSLDIWNLSRSKAALIYDLLLSKVAGVKTPPTLSENIYPVYHLYELDCGTKESRDGLEKYLKENNIGCGLHYPIPCHKQSMYAHLKYSCPVSERLSDTLISLPIHPKITSEELLYVCDCIAMFCYEVL